MFRICERVGSVVRLDRIFSSERSERATITICKPYIYLILPSIYFVILPNLVSHFGHLIAPWYVEKSTIYVRLFINCKPLSVGNMIKTSGSSGCCEYLDVPMCQNVGL